MSQVAPHQFTTPSASYVEPRNPQVHMFQLTSRKVYFSKKARLNILNHSLGFS